MSAVSFWLARAAEFRATARRHTGLTRARFMAAAEGCERMVAGIERMTGETATTCTRGPRLVEIEIGRC